MTRKVVTPAKKILPQLVMSNILPQSTTERCGTCKCFLVTNHSTGKGRCRFFPPATIQDREATIEDPDGRRWPLCWESEWCEQWVNK